LPGVAGAPYKAIADALEVIPRTLIQNCGGNVIRTLTELRVSYIGPGRLDKADNQAKHAAGESMFGVDGDTGKVTNMKDYGLLESASVKIQTLKTAIEVSSPSRLLVRLGSS
jgi:T-complex protein 1 subunit gamma